MSVENKNNAFLASESDLMRQAMKGRRLTDVPHLIPMLDALPKSAVVCEVGCGPGGITLDLAQRYPHLTVLGMDIDEISIKDAQATATEAQTANLTYSVGDAVNLSALSSTSGFEALNAGCDLVYSHAAIMHTGDQIETVRQMRLACKVGGVISMKEGDMGLFFAYPSNPGMQRMLQVLPLLGAGKGADPYAGRKLISYALAAGYSRDQITEAGIAASTTSTPDRRPGFVMGFSEMFRRAARDRQKMEELGVEEEDVRLIHEGLKEWAACEDAICSFPSLIVNAVKGT